MSIINYFKETKGELAHVNWPSRKQSITFSLVVIVVSIATSLFLGAFDFLFSRLLNIILN